MKLPFSRSYWVKPGRLLAGFYPGDKVGGKADEKLQGLLGCGVSYVLNLMERDEVNYGGELFAQYDERLQELGRQAGQAVECVRRPIVDRMVPSAETMRGILGDLTVALSRGEVAYVHCWGGRGRTATVVGCYLRRAWHLSGAETLALLRQLTQHNPEAFWPAPQMPCQAEYILNWRDEA